MGYPRRRAGLGDTDAQVAQALHQAALAVVAARRSGDPDALAAAQQSFNALRVSNGDRIAALEVAESAPTGLLDQLQATLAGAGKAATIGLLLIAVFTFGPSLLRIVESRSPRSRIMRRNPRRRRGR